jgi:type IV secretory pathway VirJ component
MKNVKVCMMLFIAVFFAGTTNAQSKEDISKLPVSLVTSSKTSGDELVLYLTGDGGWNNFSQKLANEYAAAGVPVVALNSMKYFWSKKSPEESAADIAALLNQYLGLWKKKSVLLCGYSFGADVMPFIFNKLPADLKSKVSRIQLLSPSAYTDFEIHVSYLFISKKMNVASEVQKINKPVLCYYGVRESDKPLKDIEMPNFKMVILNGDHHYENSMLQIVDTGLASKFSSDAHAENNAVPVNATGNVSLNR